MSLLGVWRSVAEGVSGSSPPDPLTGRERAILELLASGRGDGEIATVTGLSVRTVVILRTRIYEKIGVGSRRGAVGWAREHRLFEQEPSGDGGSVA